jgi:hypothetical protein
MTDLRIQAALAPVVLVAAALASAPSFAAPIVSFAQGQPAAEFPCAVAGPGPVNPRGECVVPAAVGQARADWLANVAGQTVEEFETSTSRQLGTNTLFSGAGSMTATASNVGFYDQPLVGSTFLGRFNTTLGGGSAGWWFEFAAGTATIRFSSPVEAFAFYLTDLGDEGGSASVSLFNGQTAIAGGTNLAVVGQAANNAPRPLLTSNYSVLFFGVKSDGDPFDSMTLSVNRSALGANDFVGMDSLVFGNVDGAVTPLSSPGTLALAGIALLGLRCFRGKR